MLGAGLAAKPKDMKTLQKRLAGPVFATCAALAPAAVQAHPHIFVDTGLAVQIGAGGALEAVEVTWAYDEFYSLLIFEDLGLDPDADGVLTDDELTRLKGFDLNWSADYDGDTYLTRNEAPLALMAPEHLSTEVVDGRITTRHRRGLKAPVPAEAVVIRAYDPTYYTAYTVNQGVSVGAGCRAEITEPDLDRAYTLVEELLYAMPADQAEAAYPEVGEAFADTVQLICGD